LRRTGEYEADPPLKLMVVEGTAPAKKVGFFARR
jgi:hypothetical protein